MTSLDLTAASKQTSRGERLVGAKRVLGVLFVFSACAALSHQIAWQQALSRDFDVTIASTTFLVTAFMLGLGLGSLAGGWLSKRRDIALLPLLAAIELLTAAFGLVSLAIFGHGEPIAGWAPLAMAGVALIVPALLIGAALPVLMGHLMRRCRHVGDAVGLVYSVTLLGAGAACIACFAVLLPLFGAQGATIAAVAINGAAALGALATHRREREDPALRDVAVSPSNREPLLGLPPVLALAAAGGFVSWSYAIFFFGTVFHAAGSGAVALAATLGPFLLGLASGSRQAGNHCEIVSPEETMRRAVATLMKANLLGLMFLPLLNHLAFFDHAVLGVAMLMVFLAARFWGRLLPYLAELGVAADPLAGTRTALLTLANTIGAATGAILTGFWLLGQMSIVAVAVTLVLAGLVGTALMVGAFGFPRWQKLVRAGVIMTVAVLALLLIPPLSADVLQTLHWPASAP